MKSRIIIILTAVLVLGAVVFVWWQEYLNTNQQIADWETYRNEQYGIEFKHPPGWYIWESEDSAVSIYEHEVGSGLPGVTRLMHVVRFDDTSSDIKAFAETKTPEYPEDPGAFYTLLEKEEQYIRVAGTRGYQVYIKRIGGGPLECNISPCEWEGYKHLEDVRIQTYIPHESGVVTIGAEIGATIPVSEDRTNIDPEAEAEYLELYNNILSTFRFISAGL